MQYFATPMRARCSPIATGGKGLRFAADVKPKRCCNASYASHAFHTTVVDLQLSNISMSLSRSAPRYDDGLEIVYPSTLEPVTERGSDAHHEPYKTHADYQTNVRPDSPKRRTVCGMPTSTSILAIALIVVVVAAGVGGGVGGSIAVMNAKRSCTNAAVTSSSESSTPAPTASPASGTNTTATSSSPFAVKTNVLLPLDCPGLSSTPQSSTFAHRTSTFQMYCHQGPVYDTNAAILSIIAYTLHDCLQACVSFNHYVNADNCTAASFYANLTAVLPTNEANCFLRTSTGHLPLDDNDAGDYLVTGLIDLS
ncbi:hypothetical protein F5B21DRAFT_499862 [Xylaria acuta]|nr:hypothetical protein F5B21DRAFT_499862 [Xylaria acuta]